MFLNSVGSLSQSLVGLHPEISKKCLANVAATFALVGQVQQAVGVAIIDQTPQDLLIQGILDDSPDQIREAIRNGAEINSPQDAKAPLILAVLTCKHQAVDELIKMGANVRILYMDKFLILHSMKFGDLKTVLLLLKAGCPFSGFMDQNKTNVMDWAINYVEHGGLKRKEALEIIEGLIDRGYNIHSSHWNTNVFYSAITSPDRREEALKVLLARGANPNQIIDTSGLIRNSSWTPLLLCIKYHNFEAARILLTSGANINQKANPYPHKGGGFHTPLSYALELGNQEMVAFLIKNGAAL